MRVLLINSVCGIKSTGRIVGDIAENYISEGHLCKIAYGREEVPEKYRDIAYRIGNDFNIKINALKARVLDNEGFNAIKATQDFLEWAEDYNPDLLWLHNLHGYYINIDLLFQWIKNRPNMKIRWTLHDCWAFTGHCAHFTYVKCDKWKYLCTSCVQKGCYPKSVLFNRAKVNYLKKKQIFTECSDMTIFVPSNWLKKMVEDSFLNQYPIKVENNEIDLEIFKYRDSSFREKYRLSEKKIVLGVSSSWNTMKGLDDFIELSKMLDSAYQIILVGVTRKQMKLIPSNVLAIEKTNNAIELAEIYSAADVFVNLTYEDTYPTVNLEAQACRTPCVTYRTGGSPECVPDKNVIDVGDLKMLINRIHEICFANN